MSKVLVLKSNLCLTGVEELLPEAEDPDLKKWDFLLKKFAGQSEWRDPKADQSDLEETELPSLERGLKTPVVCVLSMVSPRFSSLLNVPDGWLSQTQIRGTFDLV